MFVTQLNMLRGRGGAGRRDIFLSIFMPRRATKNESPLLREYGKERDARNESSKKTDKVTVQPLK